mmetsp:Transcript_44613/g.52268  ORF Transcript_44613/g.52268 Transcript_44613/m.52268 type:complete len:81 (-) Transcript_44613:117-359(-)
MLGAIVASILLVGNSRYRFVGTKKRSDLRMWYHGSVWVGLLEEYSITCCSNSMFPPGLYGETQKHHSKMIRNTQKVLSLP